MNKMSFKSRVRGLVVATALFGFFANDLIQGVIKLAQAQNQSLTQSLAEKLNPASAVSPMAVILDAAIVAVLAIAVMRFRAAVIDFEKGDKAGETL